MNPPPFLGILTPLNEEDPPPLSQALLLYIGTTYIGGGGVSHKEFFIFRSILTVRYLKTLPASARYFFLRSLISEPLKIGFSMFATAKSLFFLNR